MSAKTKYTSKGERNCVAASTRSGMRAARSEADAMLFKQKAFASGKVVYMTIDNPNKAETAKRRIRVRMDEVYIGDMRGMAKNRKPYIMQGA